MLCRGDRRTFAVVDAQGTVYSPPRLLGVKTAELRGRWADLNPQTLLLASEAHALREAQWVQLQEEGGAAAARAVRESMTLAEQQQEQALLAEIAALEVALYQEFRENSLGAETHAATLRLGVLPNDFEQWQQQHLQATGAGDGTTVFKAGYSQQPVDRRRLITQLQHWQTTAEADSERRSPQDGSTHGRGIGGRTVSTDGLDAADTADIESWGLSPTTLLMLQTYGGRHAEAEQLRRIEAALAAASTTGNTSERSQTAAKPSLEKGKAPAAKAPANSDDREPGATALYVRELGQHLRAKGKGAYTQADRWLAEKLARRGYSRQETRRVIARSSPELMQQVPGQRVGYIRRIVDRVYRQREHWQERLAGAKGDHNVSEGTVSKKTGAPTASPTTVAQPDQRSPRRNGQTKTPLPKPPPPKPKAANPIRKQKR